MVTAKQFQSNHPNRRQVVQTLAISGSTVILGSCAPSVVRSGKREKIADLSSLKSEGASVQFKYDNVQTLLVRSGKTLRTTELRNSRLFRGRFRLRCDHACGTFVPSDAERTPNLLAVRRHQRRVPRSHRLDLPRSRTHLINLERNSSKEDAWNSFTHR
jgi:hypothetical protein